ncbi:MAG: pyruvate formate lyase family protein, partial [Thermoguttaceae bacterium]|nr:pyruvate formate lyase family protein [Thermoguttaceae bacterium]
QILNRQYEAPDFNPETGLEFDALERQTLALTDSMAGQPHPVVKAKAVEFILDHAQLAVNPLDWFGFDFNVAPVRATRDFGWQRHHIINDLSRKWIDELNHGPVEVYTSERIRMGREDGLFVMYPDYDHTAPDWESILRLGFPGILERVRRYRGKHAALSPEQTAFFDGMEITYTAILRFSRRLTAEVGKHAGESPKTANLFRALNWLVENPPSSLYEAMVMGLLYWKLQENVDGFRVRTLGDIGNLYFNFYQRDMEQRTYSREQVKELFKYFMNQFFAMHIPYQQPMYFGSMDANGRVEINELSRLIFDAYDEADIYDPKIQICITEQTPDDFIKRVLKAIRRGNSSVSLINSENTVKALLKTGVTLEEARTYVMTGCWDFAVKNEAKTIPLRLNLPKIVELVLNDGIDPLTGHRLGSVTGAPETLTDFGKFHAAFKRQLKDVAELMMKTADTFEKFLHEYNPSSMYSATIAESLEKRVDAYGFGARHCNSVFNISCLATTVDSLAAIKKFVYDRKVLSLQELTELLKRNWEGGEELRRKILADDDKYGNDSALADQLMVDLTDDTTKLINNRPNGRGGIWKQGQISIDFNVRFGTKTGATPDGRKSGDILSKNLSATIGMDRNGLTGLMNSVCKMDMSNFAHAGMLDIILPPSAVKGDEGLDIMLALVRTYFKMGGHSIQCNVFDSKLLLDAQAHPEKYATLQVRVCGWNVYFVNLSRQEQDLFIAQAEHVEKEGIRK